VLFALNLQARVPQVAEALQRAVNAPGPELVPAALAIARVEYPALETTPYLQRIDEMGADARARIAGFAGRPALAVRALNEFIFDELGFRGNRERYDDPRNSFLNEVLDRRTGIPITLAVIYIEVARRAGLAVEGVNFPGHFLLRVSLDTTGDSAGLEPHDSERLVIIDPFHGGASLSETDCRQLLREHVGEEAAFDTTLLEPATRLHIVTRMLVNLKRLYVRMRSFPQARFVSDLLLTIDPSAIAELRDRGLLAYHLEDFAAALRDLEAYLRHRPRQPGATSGLTGETSSVPEDLETAEASHDAQIWEHVKTLRRRVAGMN
jgi:regulator of sirC expression with transglutaminase-like and TPR domain